VVVITLRDENLKKNGRIETWTCTFCSIVLTASGSDVSNATTLVPGADQVQTVSLTTDKLREIVSVVVMLQLQPLSNKIDSLQLSIEKLTSENFKLRTELMKLNRNSQSRAVSEQKLQKLPTDLSQEDIETKASYAKAVAKNSQKTIIVLPKDRNQTVNKTKADIINRVDPINTSVNIGKVKNLRHGGLLLGCDNTDELKQIVKEKLSDSYEVREISSVRPRIRVSGISENLSEVTLLIYLSKQNECIFGKKSELKLLKLAPLKNNHSIFCALIEVDIST
jgi:hypothetical protein